MPETRSYQVRCDACDRALSAAFAYCPWCGEEQDGESMTETTEREDK